MKTPQDIVREYVARTGKTDPDQVRQGLKKKTPVPMAIIRSILSGTTPPSAIPRPALRTPPSAIRVPHSAINLSNVRVSDRKPNEGLKAKFFKLQKGKGYPLAAIAEEWAAAEDTIRNHAKRLDCLKYVEVSPGEWIPCILHPDTATAYKP